MEWPYYVLADLTKTEPIPMDQVLSYPVRIYDPLPINELTTPVWKRQSLDMGMAHLADDSHEPEGVISTLELAKANAAFQAAQKKKQQLKEKGALPYDARSDLKAIQEQQQKILGKKDDLVDENNPETAAEQVAKNMQKQPKPPTENSVEKASEAAANAEQAAAVTKTFDAYLEELHSKNLDEITEQQLNQLKQLAGDDGINLNRLHAFVVDYLQDVIETTIKKDGADEKIVDPLNRLIESYATRELITPAQSADLSRVVNQEYQKYLGTRGQISTSDQKNANVDKLGQKKEDETEDEDMYDDMTNMFNEGDNILNQQPGNTIVPLNPPADKDPNGNPVGDDPYGNQELKYGSKEDPNSISVDKLAQSQNTQDATNISEQTNVPEETDEEKVPPTPADSGTRKQTKIDLFIERVGDFMPKKVKDEFTSVNTTNEFKDKFGDLRYNVILYVLKNFPTLRGDELAAAYKKYLKVTPTGQSRKVEAKKLDEDNTETEGWGYEDFKRLVNKYKRRRIN